MAQTRGISGLAVVLAATGGFLVYAGIRNVPLLAGLRELTSGQVPTPIPVDPTDVTFTAPGVAAGVSAAPGATGLAGLLGNVGLGGYSLGAVKPHVEQAAYAIGPRFGIRTVYGWAPGQYDHPKGLALDFMVSDLPGDAAKHKTIGDALAAFVLANAAALRVSYVIWYRRSWNPKRGTWAPYSGDSEHTDHVHVSFLP